MVKSVTNCPVNVIPVPVPGVRVIEWLSKPIAAVPTLAAAEDVISEKFGTSPTVAADVGVASPSK